MGRRIVLSDEIVEERIQRREKLQYRLTLTNGTVRCWKAEVIGPGFGEFIGREAFGSTPDKATSNLFGQLARQGFIGRLIET